MTDPNRVTLWCDVDDCDAHLTLQAPDTELRAEERAELSRLLLAMARARRWSIVGRRHRCPACGAPVIPLPPPSPPRFADGTQPGTEQLHGDRCQCAGAGCGRRASR